jgi:hypothetical protein
MNGSLESTLWKSGFCTSTFDGGLSKNSSTLIHNRRGKLSSANIVFFKPITQEKPSVALICQY